MVNEPIKQYAVIQCHKFDTIQNGYYHSKVFHARADALEYLNALNTASQYEDKDVEYLLYVLVLED
jgi:hypothetical protein